MIERGKITRQVTRCTNCQLCHHQPRDAKPVPATFPKSPIFAVVGEAPGPDESLKGRPFIGASGKLLRALMSDVGISPRDDVAWINTVSCFPNKDGQIRSPSDVETLACRTNLLDQLAAAEVGYVLLVGAKALHAWRSDLLLKDTHGQIGIWLEAWVVMPITHPAASFRKPSFKAEIRRDLKRWTDIAYGGDDPLLYLDDGCVKCGVSGGEALHRDRDGLGWCNKHWEKSKHAWEKERQKWGRRLVEPLTMEF